MPLRPPMRILVLALLLVLASCSSDTPAPSAAAPAPEPPSDEDQPVDEEDEDGADDQDSGGDDDEDDEDGEGKQADTCAPPEETRVAPGSLSAEAVELSVEADVEVRAVVYPHPDYEGRPWTQWGQGLVLNDGRFLSAIGDHCGADGNSYFYEYDPVEGSLRVISDVLSQVEHRPGAWGYGKIHAQLLPGLSGEVYATTYWGSREGLAYEDGYEGDLLLRLDPDTGALEPVTVPVPRHGLPSMAAWAEGGLLYGEAVDPESDPYEGPFFVYDVEAGEVVFESGDADHVGFRDLMVGGDGTAYFSSGDGGLTAYDPGSGELRELEAELPGEKLRSSTVAGPDGTVYGVTNEPGVLFALRPSGEIDVLGPVRGDAASVALHPSGDRVFYVPEAHGDAWEQGAPLISVDTRTGEEEVVVSLNEAAEDELGLRLGGTYNVAVDPSGDRVYVGFNAGDPEADDAFGEVVLVVVELG